ncbi:MAG: hypothetical protein ACREHG_08850, partial [Candidatus Saccharimonadales bacterium]
LWGLSVAKPTGKLKTSPQLGVNHSDKIPYRAFETQDKLLGFQVHCPSVQQEHTFFYHHLLTITLSKPAYDFFFLMTSTSVIKVRGRNLQPLVVALGLHTCKSMTEFHAEWFLAPPDDTQPFIETIEVALIKGVGESQHVEASRKREDM